MIALSEASPQLPDSASLRDITLATEAARFAGWQIYSIPQDLPEGVSADDAMWHIPAQPEMVPGVWIGYVPLPSHYEQIYKAALSRNIRLLNSPDQYRRAEEFDRFYPFIADLTAESRCISTLAECEEAARQLGYPVFLKGTIQSNKAKGIGSCVAQDTDQLVTIATTLLSSHRRSLGKVIVRKLLDLRYSRIGPGGFPFGREYRAFIHAGQIVGLGFYWEGDDELAPLNPSEHEQVTHLALEAFRRLEVPYLTVDIGQTTQGDWIVIEVGDGQFSGLSQIPVHQLWARLTEVVRSHHQLA
ncbi:MAG TPA: ATP-grasp domain-containing protein [Haloferula sp.]